VVGEILWESSCSERWLGFRIIRKGIEVQGRLLIALVSRYARSFVTIKMFIKWHKITPLRTPIKEFISAEDRPPALVRAKL
jgi:hypothetical protein